MPNALLIITNNNAPVSFTRSPLASGVMTKTGLSNCCLKIQTCCKPVQTRRKSLGRSTGI